MRNVLISAVVVFVLGGFACLSANPTDSLLKKYGLSPTEFSIVTVKDAPKNVFRNLTCDAIKLTDTIIIAKVDTFRRPLTINNRLLNHRLVLSGKVFEKGVSFYSSRFKKEVYLNECSFQGRVDFSKAVFDSTLILWNAMFNDVGVFSNAVFHNAQFYEVQFNNEVQFSETKFCGQTYFVSIRFLKEVYFDNVSFFKLTRFDSSEFKQRLHFWNSIFTDTITLSNAKLMSGVDFQSSKFGLFLGMSHVESTGKIDFNDVSMPVYTDLSSLRTSKIIDFNYIHNTSLLSKYRINVYDVDFEKIMLTSQFSLYFDERLNLDVKNSIYKQFLDNIHNKGYKDIYKSFDIEYKEFLNKNYNSFIERVFYFFDKTWWNFGYDRGRVFLWTLVFVFLFSIVVNFWLKLFLSEIYTAGKLSKRYKQNRRINNSIIRFFCDYWVAVIYTIFVFFNLRLDFERLSFERFFASTFILFVYVIGLICTAFIVNLIITI